MIMEERMRRLVAAVFAASLVVLGGVAWAQSSSSSAPRSSGQSSEIKKVTGQVSKVAPGSLALKDGSTYQLAEGVSTQNLKPGMQVEVTYGMKNGQRVATDVGVVGATGSTMKPSEAGQAGSGGTTTKK
jgi:Protein of unknown function (DUF1344)